MKRCLVHLDLKISNPNLKVCYHHKIQLQVDPNIQLKLAHNSADYSKFTVADTGDLTIATVGDGTTDSDLILDADGQIKLEPAAGNSILLDNNIEDMTPEERALIRALPNRLLGIVFGIVLVVNAEPVGEAAPDGLGDIASTNMTLFGGVIIFLSFSV